MIELNPIGIIHSCFKEKFGIPRQPGLVKDAPAVLELYPEFSREEAVRELDGFSHIWLVFIFHKVNGENWTPMVRPPRLGGNKKVGVFASRSPFRPNPVGLSAVKLDSINTKNGKILLNLSGIDILDQTPVIDIKPYLPYSDIIETATGGFAFAAPETDLTISFLPHVSKTIKKEEKRFPDLKKIMTQILENDPRPAYYASSDTEKNKVFGIRLFDFDMKWQFEGNQITVIDLIKN